ncbi:MAG: hypothetical protein Q4B26_04730 [Eubacteriales bacterium]|nr:hypothetical protein [Eubacteriales bacterium]
MERIYPPEEKEVIRRNLVLDRIDMVRQAISDIEKKAAEQDIGRFRMGYYAGKKSALETELIWLKGYLK